LISAYSCACPAIRLDLPLVLVVESDWSANWLEHSIPDEEEANIACG
jgi:hypothetical protein